MIIEFIDDNTANNLRHVVIVSPDENILIGMNENIPVPPPVIQESNTPLQTVWQVTFKIPFIIIQVLLTICVVLLCLLTPIFLTFNILVYITDSLNMYISIITLMYLIRFSQRNFHDVDVLRRQLTYGDSQIRLYIGYLLIMFLIFSILSVIHLDNPRFHKLHSQYTIRSCSYLLQLFGIVLLKITCLVHRIN